MYDKCRKCWWREGTQCYQGKEGINFLRDENGRSNIKADGGCKQGSFYSKRKMFESVIPGDKLIIISELMDKK